jgi:hypothetical protein
MPIFVRKDYYRIEIECPVMINQILTSYEEMVYAKLVREFWRK